MDLVAENPVVSARFLAERLEVSKVSAHKLVKKLEAVGIIRPATGKYRKSELFQTDDILDLLAFGAEAGPRASSRVPQRPQDQATDAGALLVHRCGAPTAGGPCRNRVPASGQRCWRHRD